jgi:O-antigen/teichoic acid export membrane protein
MGLARNASWLALGQVITGATNIIFPAIIARVLVKEDVGFYRQIDLAANLIIPFMVLGFDKSVTYFVPRRETDPREEISGPVYLVLTAAVLALAFAFLFPGGFSTFGTAPLRLLAVAAALSGAAAALALVVRRAFVAVDEVKLAAILPTVLNLPRAIALIVVGIVFPSLTNVLWVVIISSAAAVAAWVGVAIARGYLSPRFTFANSRKHFQFGGPLAFASLVQSWAFRMDRYLVASMLGAGTYAVYSYGKTKVPFLPIVSRALGDATSPRYSELESKGKYREMGILFRMSCETILPFGLLMSLFFSSTAHWTIPFAFTDAYIGAVPIFRVFAFTIVMQSIIGAEQVLRALSAIRFLVLAVVISLPIRVAVGMYMIQNSSLTMLAIADLVISLCMFAIRLAYIQRRLDIPWLELHPFRSLVPALPYAGAGLIATAVVNALVGEQRLLSILVAGGVWGILIFISVWRQGLLQRMLPERIVNRIQQMLERGEDPDEG